MGRVKTPAWIDVAIHLRREGRSLTYIAALCDAAVNKISYHLMVELGREEYESLCLGVGTKETRERSQEIIDRLNNGESPYKIAESLGVQVSYIYNFKHFKAQSFLRRVEEEASRNIFNIEFWENQGYSDIPDTFETLDSRI